MPCLYMHTPLSLATYGIDPLCPWRYSIVFTHVSVIAELLSLPCVAAGQR